MVLVAAIAAEAAAPVPTGSGGSKPIETIAEIPRKSRLAMFKAQQAREKGNFEEAATELLDFIAKNPENDHYLLRFHLGNSLARLERYEEALTQDQAAVRLEGRYAQGWLNLGEMAYNLGKYGIAAEAILKGYEFGEDKPPRLLYFAAASYIMDKQPGLAAPILEELVSGAHGEPQMDWYKALIQTSIDLNDAALGRRAVTGMLQSFPGDDDAWLLAFQFAAGMSDYRQAAIALTVVGYLRPLTHEERMMLGDIYNALEIPARAGMYYEEAIAGAGTSQEYERLASAHLAAYDFEAAEQTLKKALENDPTVRLWSLLGDLYFMRKDYEQAYRAFEKCAALDPEFGRAFLMMGYCALEMGNISGAVPNLQIAANHPKQEQTARALLKRVAEFGN
jgi:tetratricopeptide (TPR) repeat protein